MHAQKLLERIARLIEINLHDLLLESADRRETMAYWRAEMEGGLADAKDAVAQAIAQTRRLEKQIKAAQSSADEWDRQVDTALQAGDDAQARAALAHKTTYERVADELQRKLAHQHQVTAEMKKSVSALQAQVIALARLASSGSVNSGSKSS